MLSKLFSFTRFLDSSDQEKCRKFETFLNGEHWLKDIDAHGLVYTDGEFGSLELDASSLLYIAEQKKPKESLLNP
jgi:hypothetical protein